MFKRAYAISLRPDLPPAVLADLVGVLEDSPRFIPGMVTSRVRPALGSSPFDLVWDNDFVSREAYEDYLAHPYHCNVIDHYMYRESPAAAISDSLCLRWSDDDPPPAGADTPPERTDEALVVDAVAGKAPHPESPMPVPALDQGPLFLVETVQVLPGTAADYLGAVAEEYAPLARARGVENLLALRSPRESGEDEVVLVWRLRDWQAFVDFRDFFQFSNEPASSEWVARISALRRSGRRRLFLGADLGLLSGTSGDPDTP